MLNHIQPHLPGLPPHDPDDRRAVVVHGPVASDLVGPPPGRILGILVRHPFFAGILVHLIGFDHRVLQRGPIRPGLALGLQPMAQVQEMSPAAGEFPCQLGGGRPLGETAEDQDDLRGTPWVPWKTVPVQALKTRLHREQR